MKQLFIFLTSPFSPPVSDKYAALFKTTQNSSEFLGKSDILGALVVVKRILRNAQMHNSITPLQLFTSLQRSQHRIFLCFFGLDQWENPALKGGLEKLSTIETSPGLCIKILS